MLFGPPRNIYARPRVPVHSLQDFNDELPSSNLAHWQRIGRKFSALKMRFRAFQASRYGIFLLERWLPLQDVTSDALVAYCYPAKIPVWFHAFCSDDGFIVNDPFWTIVATVLIILPYAILWWCAWDNQVRWLQRYLRSRTIARAAYAALGLPGMIALDIYWGWPKRVSFLSSQLLFVFNALAAFGKNLL